MKGDVAPNPRHRAGHVLEFDEAFEGDRLSEERWLATYLPHWNGAERGRPRYRLDGNTLQLRIDEDQPAWHPEVDGELRVSSIQTGTCSGPVGSTVGQHRFKPALTVREAQETRRLYTPTYGFIEVRLRAVTLPGYVSALWMIGFEERPEESGEICVCEIFGDRTTPETAQVGFGLHAFGDGRLRDEFFQDTLPIDAARFHIYAVDWTPDGLDFYVDNVRVRRVRQSPAYPFQLMLSLYEVPHLLGEGGRTGPWPKVMEVDYVRGYRRVPDADA